MDEIRSRKEQTLRAVRRRVRSRLSMTSQPVPTFRIRAHDYEVPHLLQLEGRLGRAPYLLSLSLPLSEEAKFAMLLSHVAAKPDPNALLDRCEDELREMAARGIGPRPHLRDRESRYQWFGYKGQPVGAIGEEAEVRLAEGYLLWYEGLRLLASLA